VLTLGNQERCARVPQIVEADGLWQPRLAKRFLKAAQQVARVYSGADRGCENIHSVRKYLLLPFQVLTKNLEHCFG
jgi:hypothetical protein